MGDQYHVAGPIGYSGVRMGYGIVKQLLDLAHGVCCWACLLRCDRAHSGKHREVYRSRIVEECATHLLEEIVSHLVKGGGVVLSFALLSCRPIVWGNVWVGLILGRLWAGMFEARQCVFHVPWHGDVYFLFFVIPVYGEPNVLCARPVMGYCIVFFEGVHEVFGVLPHTYLTPKLSTHRLKEIGRQSCYQKLGQMPLCR